MAAACASCQTPLVVTLDLSDDDDEIQQNGTAPVTVPDDVHLHACGHHFHWQCLLDAYTVTHCPACQVDLTSPPQGAGIPGASRIICTLNNEGGLQENIDILPQLSEEGYLKAYPEERKAHAFHEFCREGDLDAVLQVLQDDDEEDPLAYDVLRYQDQLNDMQSPLHAAVAARSQEIAWLLLYLSSSLELDHFPADLLQQAQSIGLERGDNIGKVDIRNLKDSEGRTAEQFAATVGDPWASWIGNGRLSA